MSTNFVKKRMQPDDATSKNPSPEAPTNLEKLNQALPPLVQPEDRQLNPGENANEYYGRLESFRRVCEARAVLRWIADGYFDSAAHLAAGCRRSDHSVACYVADVASKRSNNAASVLKNDVLDLYYTAIERDPSLQDLLQSQIKLLK